MMISLALTCLLVITKLHLCGSSSVMFGYEEGILSAYQTVGIFSKCTKDEDINSNKTSLHHLARSFENELRGVLNFQKNYNFISYDVCNYTDLLVQLITDLLLDRKYYLSLSTTNHEITDQNKALSSNDQNIIIVIAYVTEEMSNIIRRVLGNLHHIIARLCIPHQCDDRFPFSEMDDYIGQITDFVSRFGMRDLTFINIEHKYEEPTLYQTYYNKTYDSLKNRNKFCLRRKTIYIGKGYTSYKYSEKLLKDEITPILNKGGANKSNVVFFGRFGEMRSLAHEISYDLHRMERERVVLFQDIGWVSGVNDNEFEQVIFRRTSKQFI